MRRRGFTLVEVLVAMALVAILFATIGSVVQSTIQRRREAEAVTRVSRVAGAILDIMVDDLQGAYLYGLEADGHFTGEDHGSGDGAADFLHFVTTTDSRVPVDDPERDRKFPPSDLTEVSYMLRENPDLGTLSLYRREDYYIDDTPTRGGVFQLMYDRVLSLDITYMPGDLPETSGVDATGDASSAPTTTGGLGEEYDESNWVDEWESSTGVGFPAAVKIDLVLRIDFQSYELRYISREDTSGGFRFIRYVTLPSYSPAQMLQHEADPELDVPQPPTADGDQPGETDGEEDATEAQGDEPRDDTAPGDADSTNGSGTDREDGQPMQQPDGSTRGR